MSLSSACSSDGVMPESANDMCLRTVAASGSSPCVARAAIAAATMRSSAPAPSASAALTIAVRTAIGLGPWMFKVSSRFSSVMRWYFTGSLKMFNAGGAPAAPRRMETVT